jgi:hypothetical protein
MVMRSTVFQIRCWAALIAWLAISGAVAIAGEVQTDGKITVPETAPLFAVCTDPVVQQTLEQDFRGAHRGTDSGGTGSPVTVTVIVTERLLKPGTVLADFGAGDPWVLARLMRAAGAEPPPIGDTGDKHLDPYGEAARKQLMDPDNPTLAMQNYYNFRNEARRPEGPRFGSNGNAGDDQLYDRVIVARASVGGSPDQMTALVVVHPSEDVHSAKELVAEEIANAILH